MTKTTKGIITCTLSMLFLSTYSIFGKILLENLIPETLALLSQSISVVTIFVFFGFLPEFKKIHKLPRKDLIILLVVALLSAVVAPLFLLKGLQNTSATNSVIIGRLEPVFAGIVSYFWLKEKTTKQQIGGAILMFAGVIFIVTKGLTQEMSFDYGNFFVIISALAWAISTNIFKKYLCHILPELVVLFRNFVGSIVLFIFVPIIFNFSHTVEAAMSKDVLFYLFLFSILTIIAAQFLWYKTLELIPASLASSIGLLSPFFGVILAVSILGEKLFSFHYIGFILVIIGLFLTIWHHKKHPNHHIHLKIKHWTH